MPQSSNQISYTLLRRKPSKWEVEFEGRTATVERTGIADRGTRWKLTDGQRGGFFKSRRAAFHFFKTGERFVTKPIYSVVGGKRSQRRVR